MRKNTVEDLLKLYPIIAERENLKKEYIDNKLSILEISKKYKIVYNKVLFLLEFYKIPKRNMVETCKISNKKTKLKIKEKYGVDNISKLGYIKEKKKETFIKNYGFDNIFKKKDFSIIANESYKLKTGKDLNQVRSLTLKKYLEDNPDVREKCTKTLLENTPSKESRQEAGRKLSIYYKNNPEKIKQIAKKISSSQKKFWASLNDDEKHKKMRHLLNIGSISGLEKRIWNILFDRGIPYEPQFYLDGFYYDIKINDIIIEVNGDYWHANPLFYKEDDLVIDITAKEIWHKDKIKLDILPKYNLRLLILWENDINRMTDEDIFCIIKDSLTL